MNIGITDLRACFWFRISDFEFIDNQGDPAMEEIMVYSLPT